MRIKGKTFQANKMIHGIKIRIKLLALITIFKNDWLITIFENYFDPSEYEVKQLVALV